MPSECPQPHVWLPNSVEPSLYVHNMNILSAHASKLAYTTRQLKAQFVESLAILAVSARRNLLIMSNKKRILFIYL